MTTSDDHWGLADDDVVLVVEDNDGDARLVELMLIEAFGRRTVVRRAATCASALTQLVVGDTACVLLDLGLPDGDGVDTVRSVVSAAPDAAIVVLTGDSSADTIAGAVGAGAQDYLVKGQASAESVGRAVRYALLRKRSERRTANALAQLGAIVNSTTDAIFGTTLDGVVTSWNAGAAAMYGYTPEEMVGQDVSVLLPPEKRHELTLILERVRQGKHVESFETTRLRQDGSTVDVSISISPIRSEAGAVVGASSVARDVTERNRHLAVRHALEDRLHQTERLESLGQLAGGIAHDFNNLLAVIINYAGFIAERTPGAVEVQADVERIRGAAERAAHLTRQLLTFAQRGTVQPEALDLSSIVSGACTLITRRIGARIELVTDLAPGLPSIDADRGQLEQVLVSLAVRARDAMPGGGILTISTRVVDTKDPDGARSGAATGPWVELTVNDDGVAMTDDETAHVFEPFFTAQTVGDSSGMELATVHGAVAEARGTIRVSSDEDVGTTFTLRFPSTAAHPAPAVTPPAVSPPRACVETILVVDDEPAVLELTARILRRAGYTVLEATTYERALALARSDDFQLLLTDTVMPDVPGRTLATHLDELRPGRPVLFMSGYSQDMLSTNGVLDPGVVLLNKPFDRDQLLAAVRGALTH